MKLKSKSNAIALLVILILAFLFYWYEWRQIRLVKKCQFWSIEKAISVSGDRVDAIYYYKKCLRENGIDK